MLSPSVRVPWLNVSGLVNSDPVLSLPSKLSPDLHFIQISIILQRDGSMEIGEVMFEERGRRVTEEKKREKAE